MPAPNRATDPRAALVVGGSAGIGLAVARGLRRQGYDLGLAGRDGPRLARAMDDLVDDDRDAAGVGETVAIVADIAEPGGPAAMVERHLEAHGRLDVLVVSSGTGWIGPFEELRDDRLERMTATNVLGPMRLVRAAHGPLREAGAEHGEALVVLLASLAGIWPTPAAAAYSATKAAVVSLARSLNRELAPSGVRACAICPGFVDTAMTGWVGPEIPRPSMLRPEDVSETVDYLLRLSPGAVVDEVVLHRALAASPFAP